MPDSTDHHHRPRTTRSLADRAVGAARDAGADGDHFHDALGVAVAYLEAAAGTLPPCPYCGGDLRQEDDTRLTCQRGDGPCADRYVPWTTAVGLNGAARDADVPNPLSRGGGSTRRLGSQFSRSRR